MSNYLNEITLIGYKSIRELKTFQLKKGLNILIGANGTGKTNFIRFFEMLNAIINSKLQNYISAKGRADAFLFRGMKTTPALQAHLKFGFNEYKFSLKAADDRSLFFDYESAPFNGLKFGYQENYQGSGHVESKLVNPRNKSEEWALNAIRDWRIYHFHDTSASAPMMGLCNSIDKQILHANAANIAPFLMNLEENYPVYYKQIEEIVRSIAPFFGQFYLKEISLGQTQLLWQDRYSDLLYYPHQLSDGTLRFICLTTLLLQPEYPSMLILDEPELGLHPLAIQKLAEMLKFAAKKTQLLVSTQSSLLIDEFQAEDIIVFNHENGETRLQRLESNSLDNWLNEYTLGQLWEKNLIGGLP